MRYGRTPEKDDKRFDNIRATMIPITAVSALLSFLIFTMRLSTRLTRCSKEFSESLVLCVTVAPPKSGYLI